VSDDAFRKKICTELVRLLKEERIRRNLSLNALSSRAGLNRQTISFLENEERMPTFDTLLRVTGVLGVKLEDVIAKARREASR
jgi:transcriptional regulator with XRE-family HTH domain